MQADHPIETLSVALGTQLVAASLSRRGSQQEKHT